MEESLGRRLRALLTLCGPSMAMGAHHSPVEELRHG